MVQNVKRVMISVDTKHVGVRFPNNKIHAIEQKDNFLLLCRLVIEVVLFNIFKMPISVVYWVPRKSSTGQNW